MSKDNLLIGIVGLLAGLIIGFMATNSLNQKAIMAAPAAGQTSEARSNSNIPPGHPDISGSNNPSVGPATGAGMQPQVQAALENAKENPNDFQAQVAAADAYYQIEQFDDAINYLRAANKLKPDDQEVIVHLGNANFDGDHYDEAEKWYAQALVKNPTDVDVRTDYGLTFVFRDPPNYDRAIQEFTRSLEINPNHPQTLQNLTVAYTKKGDAAKANATVGKLEALDPKNESVAKLKRDIQALQNSPQL